MKTRIRKRNDGRYVVERGMETDGNALSPIGPGYLMPSFVVYSAECYDTLKQAEKAARRYER